MLDFDLPAFLRSVQRHGAEKTALKALCDLASLTYNGLAMKKTEKPPKGKA